MTTSKMHKFIATRNEITQRAVGADIPLFMYHYYKNALILLQHLACRLSYGTCKTNVKT